MKTTINERVSILIEKLGLTANSFAQELGLNPNVIYNTLKGKSKPAFDVINKIVETYNVNPEWFIKNDISSEVSIFMDDEGVKNDRVVAPNHWTSVNRKAAFIEAFEVSEKAHRYFRNICQLNNQLDEFFKNLDSVYQKIDFIDAFIQEYITPLRINALKELENSIVRGDAFSDTYPKTVNTLEPLIKINDAISDGNDKLFEVLNRLRDFDDKEILEILFNLPNPSVKKTQSVENK